MPVMVSRRQIYEHYLKAAESALKDRIKQISEKKKISEKLAKRDPTCRSYEASVRQYKRRIKALDQVDAVNADLEKRRAERAAAPKVEKVKKKKEAAPVKAKKGGGEKKKKEDAPAGADKG